MRDRLHRHRAGIRRRPTACAPVAEWSPVPALQPDTLDRLRSPAGWRMPAGGRSCGSARGRDAARRIAEKGAPVRCGALRRAADCRQIAILDDRDRGRTEPSRVADRNPEGDRFARCLGHGLVSVRPADGPPCGLAQEPPCLQRRAAAVVASGRRGRRLKGVAFCVDGREPSRRECVLSRRCVGPRRNG